MEGKTIRIALAGNPNVGKTTIFNQMTGGKQHVGNWPGVTVEKISGLRKYRGYRLEIVDLPGIYSLTAYTIDEIVARDHILNERPDVVIQIVDATNLERNMYLTTQLMELQTRLVIGLNMTDLRRRIGDELNVEKLSSFLEIPIVETVGSKGTGIEKLFDAAIDEVERFPHHEHLIGYGPEIEDEVRRVMKAIERHHDAIGYYPLRWFALRALEGDKKIAEFSRDIGIEGDIKRAVRGVDPEEFEIELSDHRFEMIRNILNRVLQERRGRMSWSDRLDSVLTHKYLGIPIFLMIMWATFELTFTVAAPFVSLIGLGFAALGDLVADNLHPDWFASLIGNGLIGGVGGVLTFVPTIFVLFFLISILEGTGYLARAAFIMDKLMYRLGLHGKSFIPMILGFGCNVPAILSTRTIEDRNDRLITILINPFMSCSARLPVYILLAGAFFGRGAGTVIFALYVLGIIVAILSAKLFRHTILKGQPAPFIMEMPPYRVPTLRNALMQMWEKGRSYIKKAGTIILIGSLVIWAMASLPWGVEYGGEESVAGTIGHAMEPFIEPLGFDWKMGVALMFGFVAKEIVVSSLGVLYESGDDEDEALQGALRDDPGLSPLKAFSLMVFTLLYMPCLATIAVIRKETGSRRWTAFSVIYTTGAAWLVSFLIYQGGVLLGMG